MLLTTQGQERERKMMHENETDINEYHVLTVEKTTPPEGAPKQLKN